MIQAKIMLEKLRKVFLLYQQHSLLTSLFVMVRILILPFWKIDKLLPMQGTILDIGCGFGGLTNYLALRGPKRKLIGVDLEEDKIKLAELTAKKNRRISFRVENVIGKKFEADHYLMVDVLHHIDYENQKKILVSIVRNMKKGSLLLIKDVDSGNKPGFLFGHLIEKLLYPFVKIFARDKSSWIKIISKLGLDCDVYSGAFYFPDSTLIYVCRLKGTKDEYSS